MINNNPAINLQAYFMLVAKVIVVVNVIKVVVVVKVIKVVMVVKVEVAFDTHMIIYSFFFLRKAI